MLGYVKDAIYLALVGGGIYCLATGRYLIGVLQFMAFVMVLVVTIRMRVSEVVEDEKLGPLVKELQRRTAASASKPARKPNRRRGRGTPQVVRWFRALTSGSRSGKKQRKKPNIVAVKAPREHQAVPQEAAAVPTPKAHDDFRVFLKLLGESPEGGDVISALGKHPKPASVAAGLRDALAAAANVPLQTDKSAFETFKACVTAQVAKLEDRVRCLDAENAELRTGWDAEKEARRLLGAHVDDKQQRLDAARAELESLKQALDRVTECERGAQARLANVENERARLAAENETLLQEQAQLRVELGECYRELRTMPSWLASNDIHGDRQILSAERTAAKKAARKQA
ncbi:MAG: hypothetical protein KDD69_07205 [Bdellovibrionales bacterium]|nr:hypothetical protein [Bdellovibrionales bacterium]